jgi:hypothetical protein
MHAHGNNSISIKCRVKTFDYYTRQWREKVYNLMPQFCVSLLLGLLEERKKQTQKYERRKSLRKRDREMMDETCCERDDSSSS